MLAGVWGIQALGSLAPQSKPSLISQSSSKFQTCPLRNDTQPFESDFKERMNSELG